MEDSQSDPEDEIRPETAPAEELPPDNFGERIGIPAEPESMIIYDDYGQPWYRDHDEFGEWLDRYGD